MKCSVEGCQSSPLRLVKGMCHTHYKRLKRTGSAELAMIVCKCCGTEFRQKATNQTTFCSRACKNKQNRIDHPDRTKEKAAAKAKAEARPKFKHITHAHCEICAKGFWAKSKAHRICSDECRQQYDKKRTLARDKNKKDCSPRPCKECGSIFTPVYGQKERIFCGKACAKKSRNRRPKGKNAARARRAGNKYSHFDERTILIRDNWTCQLCGIPTPAYLRGTCLDNAPEVDHIVPIAKGGDHLPENCQCACRKCNGQKGTITNEEFIQAKQEARGAMCSLAIEPRQPIGKPYFLN